jgi:hypothetical protein
MKRRRQIRAQNTDHSMTSPALIDTDIAPQCCFCPHIASSIAFIHQIDHCNNSDLTPDGAAIYLICPACLDAYAVILACEISRYIGALEPAIMCKACGRPIQSLHDVIEVRPL